MDKIINLEDISKQLLQKRNYRIVHAMPNMGEYSYRDLSQSFDCPIILGGNFLLDLPDRLKALQADRYIIVTDDTVRSFYGEDLCSMLIRGGLPNVSLFSFPPGEVNKSLSTLEMMAIKILDQGISRQSCLVVLGGGVVGNIAGFLAGILMRGVRFVHVPTTVMAQIDSTTGGKQAVNTQHGKNILGLYYEPEFIYIDIGFIKTLPKREYRSGLAEAIKHGFCQSKKLLQFVRKNDYNGIVEETILLKTQIIEKDPRELSEGLILVYGHTIGHALEIGMGYTLTHGEAISIGMVAAAEISYQLGFCKNDLVVQHRKILQKSGLPITISKAVSTKKIMNALLYDKKERNKFVRFVLMEKMQKMVTVRDKYSVAVRPEVVAEVIEIIKCKN